MLPQRTASLTFADQLLAPATTEELAMAAAYVENGYSMTRAAEELGVETDHMRKALARPAVRAAIAEIQAAVGEIDFLNERFVREQILLLYPMLIGEVPVPLVSAAGEQFEARKFHPEAALKALDYIAPKKTTPTVQVNIANISRLSDEKLAEIASRAGAGVAGEVVIDV